MNKIIQYIKQHRDIFLLNYIALGIYYVVFSYMGIEVTDIRMFATNDSHTYLQTSNEFYKFSETGYSEIRPFLYPLIILLATKTIGIYGIWLLQFFCWLFSVNLIFLSVKRVTNSQGLSFLAGLIIALNISFIILTTHALTETIAILLLSMLVFVLSKIILTGYTTKNFFYVLFLLVLLTVTKPAFYMYVWLLLLIVLPLFYLKRFKAAPKKILLLPLCLLPLFFQLTMMKIKYDVFTVSNIDTDTFKPYLLTQGVMYNNSIGMHEARNMTDKMTISEVVDYLSNNKVLYLRIYLDNLINSIDALPCFVLYHNSYYQPEPIAYMKVVNKCYFYLHVIFFIPFLFFLYRVYKKRTEIFYLFPVLFVAVLLYYLLLISGLVFDEGDRLVLITLPLWVFLYALIINEALKKIKTLNVKH